jgi:hypothetical protein
VETGCPKRSCPTEELERQSLQQEAIALYSDQIADRRPLDGGDHAERADIVNQAALWVVRAAAERREFAID